MESTRSPVLSKVSSFLCRQKSRANWTSRVLCDLDSRDIRDLIPQLLGLICLLYSGMALGKELDNECDESTCH